MQATTFHINNAWARVIFVLLGISLSVACQRSSAEELDRQVAEWVILMGGTVHVEGRNERNTELSDLPANDFRLDLVDLVGTNILPQDLQRLIGLSRLRTLSLPGPMWNPRSGATIDDSSELRHL
ncbi:MAG: hypothetical protein ABI557_01900, partial [Aureliella sp.]